jgi:hypothetical protein
MLGGGVSGLIFTLEWAPWSWAGPVGLTLLAGYIGWREKSLLGLLLVYSLEFLFSFALAIGLTLLFLPK